MPIIGDRFLVQTQNGSIVEVKPKLLVFSLEDAKRYIEEGKGWFLFDVIKFMSNNLSECQKYVCRAGEKYVLIRRPVVLSGADEAYTIKSDTISCALAGLCQLVQKIISEHANVSGYLLDIKVSTYDTPPVDISRSVVLPIDVSYEDIAMLIEL